MEYHEVAIVGGGPAGSSCAYELSKNGIDVALFDHSHPREKPCGGLISSRIFEEINIPENVVERHVDWLILEDNKSNKIKIFRKNVAIMVMRKKFDNYLLNKAIKSGATFFKKQVKKIYRKNNFWILESDKDKFKSKILIGADGSRSLVRKTLYKPLPYNLLGHCVGYHILHEKEYIAKNFLNAAELYFLGQPYVNIGYAWIFPKIEYITVGIGAKLGTPNLSQSLEKFLKEHPAGKRISNPKKLFKHSHIIPAISDPDFFRLPTSGRNWILIGDAAGHVNPLTGEGIFYAVMDGKLAAKACIEKNITLYEKYWRKEYGSDLYWNAKIQKFFYNPLIINNLIKIAKKDEEFKDLIIKIIFSMCSSKKIFFEKIPLSFLNFMIKKIK